MALLRYITLAELKNQIPQKLQGMAVNDTPGDLSIDGSEEQSILKKTALASEALLESYLSPRYNMPKIYMDGEPDETVSELIKDVIVTIVKYKLFKRRDALTPAVQEGFKDTMMWLKDVQAGRANIVQLNQNDEVFDQGSDPTIEVGAEDSGSVNSQFNTFV